MKIINASKLDEFRRDNANSRPSLNRWETVTTAATWKSLLDVRQTFPATDYIKGLYCFDIGGNNHRLITDINFKHQTISIAVIMTHAEYSKWKA